MRYKTSGFSVPDIMVGIAILSFLILVSNLTLSPSITGARTSNTDNSLLVITSAVSQYKYDHQDTLPDDLETLRDTDEQYGPYIISEKLKDSWGNDYEYQTWKSNSSISKNDTFAVWSKGPNNNGTFNQSDGSFSNGATGFVSK